MRVRVCVCVLRGCMRACVCACVCGMWCMCAHMQMHVVCNCPHLYCTVQMYVSFVMYSYILCILAFGSMLCCLVFGFCREEGTDHQGEEAVEEKAKGELPHC